MRGAVLRGAILFFPGPQEGWKQQLSSSLLPSSAAVSLTLGVCPLAVSLGSLLLQASPLCVCWSGSRWRGPAAGLSLTVSPPLPAGWPGPTPSVSELERRHLEEALEAAQGEARGAQLREEQLQAECERLQEELKQLQETRAQVRRSGHRPG